MESLCSVLFPECLPFHFQHLQILFSLFGSKHPCSLPTQLAAYLLRRKKYLNASLVFSSPLHLSFILLMCNGEVEQGFVHSG